jgi:putative transcriptional regulator
MTDSLRGHFLIAGPRLRDPNFFKSAVLIVEHNDEGAMGLVINRPSSVTVASALSGHFDLPPSEGCVYQGGPVEQTALFILHNSQALDPEETPVIEDLLIGSCAEVFENVVRESIDDPAIEFRVFSGCSGWGAGQLEGELERGDWFVVPASLDYVFAKDPYAVWENLMEQVHKAHRILPDHPSNPEWN